jgi:dienelactone hydrolase
MRFIYLLIVGAALTLKVHAQEAVSLPGAGGLQIKAWHYKPVGNDSPQPVVIALHGCGGLYATAGARKGQLNARHHAMGKMLQEQGYHAIFPDSFGSRSIESTCSEVQRLKNGIQVGLDERRADVLATLAWVRMQPWADAKVPRNNVALLGWSQGAQTLLAATDARHSVVRAAGLPFKTALAFYPGCVQANRDGYRPNTALAMFLGADDDWTLPEPCIKLAERLQKLGDAVTLKVYPGAVHDFDTPLPGIRTRSDVPSRRADAAPGEGVKLGQNLAAREDSWQRVREVLRAAFAAETAVNK